MITEIFYKLICIQHALAQSSSADSAAGLSGLDPTKGAFEVTNGGGAETVYSMLEYFLNLMPAILGSLALLGLVYSGILYLGSMGDPGKMETAKKNITWIVIGIVAIASVLVVIKLAVKIVGTVHS